MRSIWVRAGDAVLMLEREIRAAARAPDRARPVLEAGDLDDWLSRLERSGRRPIERTASTLYIADPDGHRVGLSVYPRKQLLATEVPKP